MRAPPLRSLTRSCLLLSAGAHCASPRLDRGCCQPSYFFFFFGRPLRKFLSALNTISIVLLSVFLQFLYLPLVCIWHTLWYAPCKGQALDYSCWLCVDLSADRVLYSILVNFACLAIMSFSFGVSAFLYCSMYACNLFLTL